MYYFVYCSGSIKKGNSDNNKLCWTDDERNAIQSTASPYNIEFLNPDNKVPLLDDVQVQYGRDMFQIYTSNFVVVDARQRRGIGIGTEMVTAKIANKPLIAIACPGSYYRLGKVEYRGSVVENYVHPHLATLCDVIVDDFYEAGKWIKSYINNPTSIKGIDIIQTAMEKYTVNLLPLDKDMQNSLSRRED